MTDISPVRFAEGSDDIVEGLAIPFGGPFRGNADFYRTRFDKADLHLDWFPVRPVLYDHDQDPEVRAAGSVVGTVKTEDITDYDDGTRKGKWVRAQLDKRHAYFDAIKDLVTRGALGWSHGTMPYLIDAEPPDRQGVRNITNWPVAEFTLTPVEANPDAFAVHATRSADVPVVLEVLGASEDEIRQRAEDIPSDRAVLDITEPVTEPRRDYSSAADDAACGAGTLGSLLYLIGVEADEPDQVAMLQKAADALSEWIAAERAEIGSPDDEEESAEDEAISFMSASPERIAAMRAGARNSASDQSHIDAIHDHAVALGATTHQEGDDAPEGGNAADDNESEGDDEATARSADPGTVVITVMGDVEPAVRASWLEKAAEVGRAKAATLPR